MRGRTKISSSEGQAAVCPALAGQSRPKEREDVPARENDAWLPEERPLIMHELGSDGESENYSMKAEHCGAHL